MLEKAMQILKEKTGQVLSAKFGLIILLFLMPFVTFSCAGREVIQLSGMDLVFGETVEVPSFGGKGGEREEFPPEPLAGVALLLAVLGVAACLKVSKPARLASAAFGGGGAMVLLLMKDKFDENILREGGGLITLDYEFAFWAAFILFFAAAVISFYFRAHDR